MTGFGVASGETSLGSVAVECRALNHRGLTVKLRLAAECQGFEAALEARVRSRIDRGAVSMAVAVQVRNVPDAVIDLALAERVVDELRELAQKLGTAVTLSDVLAFPGVIPVERAGVRLTREVPDDLLALVDAALDALLESRRSEGASTAAAIEEQLDALERASASVAERAPQLAGLYRDRVLQRVNEFLEGRARTMEPGEVVREVAVFADRVDVAEEQQRLAAHLARGRALLAESGPIGRSLEFLVQEMLREVNTLGSKVLDADIAHQVVAMKTAIDRIREQAANLE
ncbi:MAG: YicC family protein [Planctomycetes bacterium]|nr:YicC family protein [Planctomycetota bacterium]MCB9872099.1 YicC family protein [Planctomycetota bacterium]